MGDLPAPVRRSLFFVVLLSTLSCFNQQSSSAPSAPSVTAFDPAWVNATWFGGQRGTVHDRKGHPAKNWKGRLCNASSSYPHLDNWSRLPNHLVIINTCTGLTVEFALCVNAGSLGQPAGGLRHCAIDPLKTSFVQLTFVTITNGTEGFWYRSTGNLAVNVFWCGSDQQLTVWQGAIKCI